MPLWIIQQSHRPRVSDRIMRCHSLIEWTTVRLVRFRSEWRRHKKGMDPQGRESPVPLQARRRSGTLGLRKIALESRVHVQTVGLNAKKTISALGEGEIFLLTFPFIGPLRPRGLTSADSPCPTPRRTGVGSSLISSLINNKERMGHDSAPALTGGPHPGLGSCVRLLRGAFEFWRATPPEHVGLAQKPRLSFPG